MPRPTRDFEEEEAEAWKTSTGAEHPQPRRAPIEKIVSEEDNAGERAWRKHQEAAASVDLPVDVRTYMHLDKFCTNVEVSNIASATDTTFKLIHLRKKRPRVMIYGNQDDALKAEKMLRDFVAEAVPATNSNRTKSFPKLPSTTPEALEKMYREMDREEIKQRFKQYPANDSFPFRGIFCWPEESTGEANAMKVLGANLECLDPIRTAHLCHITLDQQLGIIKVYGSKNRSVERAIERVRGTYFSFVSRRVEPVSAFIVGPSGADWGKKQILLKQYDGPKAQQREEHEEVLVEPQLLNSPKIQIKSVLQVDHESLEDGIKVEKIRRTLLHTLKIFQHHPGRLRLRAHLGRLILKAWNENVHTLDGLDAMLQDPNARAEITRELGVPSMENAAALLNPLIAKAMDGSYQQLTSSNTLADTILPQHTLVMVCEADINPKPGLIRLEKTWNEEHTGLTLETTSAWYTGDNSTRLMDLVLLDMSGKLHWGLQLDVSEGTIAGKHPALSLFANGVGVACQSAKDGLKIDDDGRFFTYKEQPLVTVRKVEQKSSWFLSLMQTSLTIEVCKIQEFERALPGKTESETVPEREFHAGPVRWSVNVFEEQWDTALSPNMGLGIGDSPKWESKLDTLFPKAGSKPPVGVSREAAEVWPLVTFLGALEKVKTLINC